MWSFGSCNTAGWSSIFAFLWLKIFVSLVIVTRYFPSRVLMNFSLSLSGMHTGCSSHALKFSEFVFLLDEASTKCGHPSLLIWLCTSLSAGVPRLRHVWWSLLALFHSRVSRTSGTDASAAYSWSLHASFFFSLSSQVRLLEICIIVPDDCAALYSRSGVGMFRTLLRVIVWIICAYLCTCGVSTVFCATLITS